MRNVSEHARQFYQSILEEGFVSPDHTWDEFSILSFFQIAHGRGYDWINELQKAGLIIKIPAASFCSSDSFYAKPPIGFVATRRPTPLTAINAAQRGNERGHFFKGYADSEFAQGIDEPRSSSGTMVAQNAAMPKDFEVNWTKWGTIATIIGLPLAFFLAWYFR